MKDEKIMNNEKLIELDESYLPQMAQLYKEAFGGDPWNDDWSDGEQLIEYIRDVSGGHHPLNYGLLIDGKLAAMSVGRINHWWEGTNYNIDELCVSPSYQGQGVGSRLLSLIEKEIRAKGLAGIFLQTDSDKPSYHFYHKNGFNDLVEHISLYKSLRGGQSGTDRPVTETGSREDIAYDTAVISDIPELVRLRILYMTDDYGSVTDEQKKNMEARLPGFYERELGKKLIAFVARAEGRLVAAAYLLIIEKPANPSFPNGMVSEVLSVYTEEEYRGRGICTKLMSNMIDYARDHHICRIELKATDEGYPLYKKLGFEERQQKYKDMRLDLS